MASSPLSEAAEVEQREESDYEDTFLPSTPRLRRSLSLSSLSTLSPYTNASLHSPEPVREREEVPFSWFSRTTYLPLLSHPQTPQRSRSQPPDAPSTGTSFVPSSPIRGRTQQERRQHRREKAVRKKQEERQDQHRNDEERKKRTYNILLQTLQEQNCTFGEFVLYVSDPANWTGMPRYRGFFSVEGRVEAVLDFWAASNVGGETMRKWAIQHVTRLVSNEGDSVRDDGFLRTENLDIDENFALGFSFAATHAKIRQLCPTLTNVLDAACTTTRQRKKMADSSRRQKETTVMTAGLICLGERSKRNDYVKALLGLFGCAEGAHRQLLTVLSHFGLSLSYSSLVGKTKYHVPASQEHKPSQPGVPDQEDIADMPGIADSPAGSVHAVEVSAKKKRVTKGQGKVGFLRRLSDACRGAVRAQALSDLLAFVYDNINMRFKVAEQSVGRKDTQENGTCSTAFPLWNARLEHLQTSTLLARTSTARILTLSDICLSADDNDMMNLRLEHTILRILVLFGGDRFAKYAEDVKTSTPTTEHKIDCHQTKIHPLPAVPIDESTTRGNAEVIESMLREVGKPLDSPQFGSILRLIAGDQLSVARIRSLVQARAGHDNLANSMLWVVPIPGLFHYKMTLTHGFMEIHYGTQSVSDPGSLAFHNHVLQRKPIVLSSLPPFRTSRDLIFVSLYARIFHCLLLVSGHPTLDAFAGADVPFTTLQDHACAIRKQFGNAAEAYKLRRERHRENLERMPAREQSQEDAPLPPPTKGDVVFENAVLYLRDALLLREFTDAIKAGDSGRVCLALRMLAFVYRGMGRVKYAHEMMHLVHHLTVVWPDELRKIILDNWLVNPTGRDNCWVEVDLLQEHLNYWIKAIYRARGSNASWEWLAMIAPCVNILRALAKQVHETFGSRQGTKHTSPDLQRDIDRLMASLAQHKVYTIVPGRCVDAGGGEIPNVVTDGIKNLQEPLTEYNKLFRELQLAIRSVPLVGDPYIPGPGDNAPPPNTDTDVGRDGDGINESDSEEDNTGSQAGDEAPKDPADEASEDESIAGNSGDSCNAEGDDDERRDTWFSLDNEDDVALDMDAFDDEEDDDNDDDMGDDED